MDNLGNPDRRDVKPSGTRSLGAETEGALLAYCGRVELPVLTPGSKSDTRDETAGRLAFKKRWRSWNRAFHRDAGHLAVGLTLIYAVSGLAVNHIYDWDPSFTSFQHNVELGAPLEGNDQAIAQTVLARLEVQTTPTDVDRISPDELEIILPNRTLHVTPSTGHVLDEGQKPRLLLRLANWLHVNRGKKAWNYVADTYAVGLILLAISGILMLPGRKGLIGRGGIFLLLGIAIPIAYVQWSGGPGKEVRQPPAAARNPG